MASRKTGIVGGKCARAGGAEIEAKLMHSSFLSPSEDSMFDHCQEYSHPQDMKYNL